MAFGSSFCCMEFFAHMELRIGGAAGPNSWNAEEC